MKEWLGLDKDEEWDAHYFDLEEVNERLKNSHQATSAFIVLPDLLQIFVSQGPINHLLL